MNGSPLKAIYAFHQIDELVGTAGQPTPDQFKLVAAAGFRFVMNLALPTSDHALAAEGSIVTGLGMGYVHLPVIFDSPQRADFDTFAALMNALAPRNVFVHCAANMRVSSFVFLYRVLHRQVPRELAQVDLNAIWEPDTIWQDFIDMLLADRRAETR